MSGKPSDEMPDDNECRMLALVTDVLLSVGASWPVVMQELLRISREPNPPFLSVPSQKTIERIFLSECGYENMTDFRAKTDETIKIRLKYKAVMMAMQGNVPMLIFSLKNLCGWSDVPEAPKGDGDENAWRLNYGPDDVKNRGKVKKS